MVKRRNFYNKKSVDASSLLSHPADVAAEGSPAVIELIIVHCRVCCVTY